MAACPLVLAVTVYTVKLATTGPTVHSQMPSASAVHVLGCPTDGVSVTVTTAPGTRCEWKMHAKGGCCAWRSRAPHGGGLRPLLQHLQWQVNDFDRASMRKARNILFQRNVEAFKSGF